MTLSPSDRAKRAAALAALEHVEPGMVVGLGSGSTAAWMVRLLGERGAAGLSVRGVPTSSATRALAERLGITLTSLDEVERIDLTIDGTDEVDPALNLIKGGGGALLQEKIVAASSREVIIIADPSKQVARLGRFPLPIEVVRFGWTTTARRIERVLATSDVGATGWRQRYGEDAPYVTDEGHYLLDLDLKHIADPERLGTALNAIPGVVESGLFTGLARRVIIGNEHGDTHVIEG